VHPYEEAILRYFAKRPQATNSTSDLVRVVFRAQHEKIEQQLQSPLQEEQKAGKRAKAQLHRKLLYHLNRLVENRALQVQSLGARGEKNYVLAVETGNIVVQAKGTTLAISKHQEPENFIEKWQNNKQVVQMTNQLHKTEAYAINARKFAGIHQLRAALAHVYTHVSDAIAIIGFESLLDQEQQTFQEGIKALLADSKDHSIALTFHINIGRKNVENSAVELAELMAKEKPRRAYTIFAGTYEELRQQRGMLQRIANTYSPRNIKLNLQNYDRKKEAHIMGRAGVYSVSEEQTELLERVGGAVISGGSYTIDLGSAEGISKEELRALAINTAKSLLSRAAMQRRYSRTLFAGLGAVGSVREQQSKAESYLRVWNYDWLAFPHPEVLGSVKEILEEFARQEQMIFATCGLPLHFKIRLTSAFPHYGKLTDRSYVKVPVYDRETLNRQDFDKRELLGTYFNCDRMRVFREGNPDGTEIINEMLSVLHARDITLLTYDFNELNRTISLTAFMK
jgi:hypothetical protein